MPAFLSKLTPRGWLAVGGAAAVAVVFLVIVFQIASAPSYSTMLTGLDPAQTGKITSTLDSKGISYQIQNGGTALAVEPSQTSQARIALAGAGLLGSSQPGMALFDKSQLGASNFQQQITYQRALEGQLAQTIEQIQGVSGAQVQIVLPDPTQQLFSDSTSPATAAVLLSDSGSLDPSAVRGIAQMVSSSVPNLSLNKVTITDSTGALLWPTSTSGADGSLVSKQAAQAQYDASMSAQLNALLSSTLGPGKAQVQVNADLNTNQSTQDSLVYAKKGVPLAQTKTNETLTGNGAGTGGVAGAAANVGGTGATTAGTTGASNYKNTSTQTTFGVNKTVTHTTVDPGAINAQSISVLVNSTVPAAQLSAIQSAVATAAGYNKKRGDSIYVGRMPFVKPVTAAPAASTSKMLGYAKYAVIGVGALLFLFFVTRMVRRREREGLMGEPTWLRELDAPRPLPALAGAPRPEMAQIPESPTQVIPLTAPVNVSRRQVEDLVERDSDRAAAQVRAWMAED
jgi:flagellar M-ring protein FliF